MSAKKSTGETCAIQSLQEFRDALEPGELHYLASHNTKPYRLFKQDRPAAVSDDKFEATFPSSIKARDKQLKADWAALDISVKLFYCQQGDCFPNKRKLEFIRRCRFTPVVGQHAATCDLDFEPTSGLLLPRTPVAGGGLSVSPAPGSLASAAAARYQPIRPRLLPPFQSLLMRRASEPGSGGGGGCDGVGESNGMGSPPVVDDAVQVIGIEYPPIQQQQYQQQTWPPAAKRPRFAVSASAAAMPSGPIAPATATAGHGGPLLLHTPQAHQAQAPAIAHCFAAAGGGYLHVPSQPQPQPQPAPKSEHHNSTAAAAAYSSYWHLYYSAICASQQQHPPLPHQSRAPSPPHQQLQLRCHPYQYQTNGHHQHIQQYQQQFTLPSFGRRDVASQFPSTPPPPPPAPPRAPLPAQQQQQQELSAVCTSPSEALLFPGDAGGGVCCYGAAEPNQFFQGQQLPHVQYQPSSYAGFSTGPLPASQHQQQQQFGWDYGGCYGYGRGVGGGHYADRAPYHSGSGGVSTTPMCTATSATVFDEAAACAYGGGGCCGGGCCDGRLTTPEYHQPEEVGGELSSQQADGETIEGKAELKEEVENGGGSDDEEDSDEDEDLDETESADEDGGSEAPDGGGCSGGSSFEATGFAR